MRFLKLNFLAMKEIIMKKILRYIVNADLFLSGISLVCLIIITFTGVISRYVFNTSYVWGEEAMLALIVWVVWFGGSAAFRHGNPIRIEIVVDMFPKRIQKIFSVFICLISTALLLYLLLRSISFLELMYNSKRVTQVLHISKTLVYSCIPISCILMIVNMIHKTFISLRENNNS